jgi:hypothetical protein
MARGYTHVVGGPWCFVFNVNINLATSFTTRMKYIAKGAVMETLKDINSTGSYRHNTSGLSSSTLKSLELLGTTNHTIGIIYCL